MPVDETDKYTARARGKKHSRHIFHVVGGKEQRAGRDRGGMVGEHRREMARGHPWVICFGPLRAQTHREQVNQLQCDMNH